MTLNEMAAQSHQTAREKGWYDNGTGPTALEKHMLMVSEIAEATEEVRNKRPPVYFWSIEDVDGAPLSKPEIEEASPANLKFLNPATKLEGEAVELADVLIRIGDYFAQAGWDLEAVVAAKMAYNRTRPHKHGGKAL